jgi:hypothetical protein
MASASTETQKQFPSVNFPSNQWNFTEERIIPLLVPQTFVPQTFVPQTFVPQTFVPQNIICTLLSKITVSAFTYHTSEDEAIARFFDNFFCLAQPSPCQSSIELNVGLDLNSKLDPNGCPLPSLLNSVLLDVKL